MANTKKILDTTPMENVTAVNFVRIVERDWKELRLHPGHKIIDKKLEALLT